MSENTNIKSEKNHFRNSFGATVLFSGVQIYQILIRIVKSKFVALFIGPAGMGIQSLLHSTTDLISASTNLGLKTSGVKTVAAAHSDNDKDKIAKTIAVLRRLILITGLFGMFICAVLAPVWSKTSFGNDEYIWSFVFVSLIILLDQLNGGELVLLQGMRQKKTLARANVIGQTVGLLMTVPLYYFFRLKAIVWVLVLSSLITLTITKFYTHKLHIEKVSVTWKETFSIGKEMIRLGIFISLQYFLQQAVAYIVRNYVSRVGGIDEVGLYSAGTHIVSTYLGLVFSAIATDYFPRLAATKSNDEMRRAVHTQCEIMLLLFAPLIVAFMVYVKPIIVLLYSERFLPIEIMMYWYIGETLFKAMGWAVSYTLLAKAKPLYFFLNEVVAKFYTVPLKLLGYKYYGLVGFGMASVAGYVIYLIQVLIVTRRLFDFKYDFSMWKLLFLMSIPMVLVVAVKLFLPVTWGYVLGTLILVLISIYVVYRLNKKLDLKSLINKKLKKKHGQ